MRRMAKTSIDTGELVADLRRRLLGGAGGDGGWGYYRGQASRIEPTAWALVALSARPDESGVRGIARARGFLGGLQRPDGLLVESSVPEANYGWNGLALIGLSAAGVTSDHKVEAPLAAALLSAKGVQLEGDAAAIRENTQLQAWSWVRGTFSWVEPTGWCLLAAKKLLRADAGAGDRIREAEAVLADRVCEPGGWNYGNSNAFTQDLRPYVPTTAIALLAMQDRRDAPAVMKSLAWLEANALAERSAMALSLAAIALRVYGRPIDALLEALVRQDARTAFLDNAVLTGMALYALTLGDHDGRAFRVGNAT
jgi:hypothetical protein